MNVKRYIINYTKIVNERIPEEIRTTDLVAYVMVLILPVVFIYNLFLAFRNLVLYRLEITPQVVYLEKLLNDRYDDDERRIYILDGNQYEPKYLFTKAELQPIFLYRKSEVSKPKTYLFTKGEVGQFTYDFVVYVPISIEFDENEMKSLIEGFKLASKFFKIQTF